MLKKIIRKTFDVFGLTINKKPKKYSYYRNEAMIAGLQRFYDKNIAINTILDVGAAEGSWSLSANEFFPNAKYLLLEPLTERKTELEKLCKNNPNFQFVSKAAGNRASFINFNVSEDLDGSGVSDSEEISEYIRQVEVTRIDEELKLKQLKGPYLIKLDTHGFEIPILEGCSEIINEVNLFIIECYGYHITKDSLLFWEMCDYMDKLGFKLIEIIDVFNRPKDNTFWQCDAFFAPKKFFNSTDNSYL
jgi:FkbM family methyltransferase